MLFRSPSKVTGNAAVFYGTPASFARLISEIDRRLIEFHASNPDSLGIPEEALRIQMSDNPSKPLFGAIVSIADSKGILEAADGLLSHSKAGAGSKLALQKAKEVLAGIYANAADKPPVVEKAIDQSGLDAPVAANALRELERDGTLTKISKDFYLDSSVLDGMIDTTRQLLQQHPATVAEIKDALGTTRKYAVPLVEYFDSHGITRRNGDLRELVCN